MGNKIIKLGVIMIVVAALAIGASQSIPKTQAAQKGYVSFTFDDGEASQYNTAYPILKKYDFPATAYITTDWVRVQKFMTWDQIRILQNEGRWEIANHTANHDELWKKKFSARYIQKDLARSQAAFAAHGIETPVSFAPPYGKWNSRLMNIVRSMGFSSSRRAWIGKEPVNNPENFNPWALEAVSLKKPRTFQSVKKYIDRAAADHKWLVFIVHGTVAGKPKSGQFNAGELQKIADYVKQLEKNDEIQVLTVQDAISRF